MDQLLHSLANLGGMGCLAAALLILHRDALKAFREELERDRQLCTDRLEQDRSERLTSLQEDRAERANLHQIVLTHLERIEQEIEEVKALCRGR
jgi:hypothetical protein